MLSLRFLYGFFLTRAYIIFLSTVEYRRVNLQMSSVYVVSLFVKVSFRVTSIKEYVGHSGFVEGTLEPLIIILPNPNPNQLSNDTLSVI